MALRASNIVAKQVLAPASRSAGTSYGASVDVSDADTVLYLLSAGETTATGTLDVTVEEGTPSAILDNLGNSRDANIELDRTTNTEVGFSFTTPDNGGVRVTRIRVACFREGTIASGKYITATIQAGDLEPDDTDLFTPVQVVVDALSTSGEVVTFNLTTPVDLDADTVYWVVLEGNYDASTSNCVHFYVDTVASGGNAMIHTTDWQSAVTTQVGCVEVWGTDFTEVENFAQITPSNDNEPYLMEVRCTQNVPGALQRVKAVGATEASVFGVAAIYEGKTRPVTNENTPIVV